MKRTVFDVLRFLYTAGHGKLEFFPLSSLWISVGGAQFTVGGAQFTVGWAAFTVGGATFTVGGATFTVGGAVFTVGGDVFTLGGATQNCYGPGTSMGPKYEKNHPGLTK